MPDSPLSDSSEVLNISLSVNAKKINDTVNITRIQVVKAVNRIATATITLLDGDMPESTFPISDTDDFSPGNKVEISAGYGSETEKIFAGIIIKHGINISSNNESTLVIECKDEAVKMTIGRKNANFIQQSIKDKDIFSTILSAYPGLKSKISDTTPQLAGLVQYNVTDWDFLVARAEANAMLVMVSDGTVTIEKPDLSKSAKLIVTYGQDMLAFSAELDARFQYSKVTSTGWDVADLKVVEETVSAIKNNADRDKKNGDLSEVVKLDNFRLQSQTASSQESLKEWANSQQSKSQLSLLRGYVKFQGSAKAEIGSMLELKGVGARFSGNVFISAIEHEISDGNWTTETEFGCSSHWFTESENIVSPAASGLIPGVEGLQIGIVKKLDEDPEKQYRIQVSVPLLEAENEGVWARMAHFNASSSCGSFVIPEIGDEVVLGYFNNDPSSPVILGSLYSPKNKAPLELTAENYIKSFTTKTKLKLQFDDENKVITLETPGGHSFVMDDSNQNIVITDSNKNIIEMNSSGISMNSPGDISLQADGKISLNATGNIEASATADVTVDGMNIKNNAKTAYSANGSASAELTASGTTTIKGAMVMIN